MNRVTFMDFLVILCLIKIVISKHNTDNILTKAKISEYNFKQIQSLPDNFSTKLDTQFLHNHVKRRSTFMGRTACGGDSFLTSGIIKSPGYPKHYPHSANCVWTLHAPNGEQIVLNIANFSIESHTICKYDFLEIRNGGYKTSPLIGKFCGTQRMPNIRSHSNILRLEFISDKSMSAPGFEIRFDSTIPGCGGSLKDPSGVITSPKYPNALPLFRECHWRITAPPGRRVKVNIEEINLPKDENRNTCRSYVAVFNETHEAPRADDKHRFCGTTPPPDMDSVASGLHIMFRTDGISAGQGFKLSYSTEEESICGGVLPGITGIFASPNTTMQKNSMIDCIWRKEINENQTFVIKFDYLDLPGNRAKYCKGSYLYAYSESIMHGALNSWCGNFSNQFIFTSPFLSTDLILVRKLDTPFGGFRGTYNVSDCGGVISEYNAVITSPGYPSNYPAGMDCDWFIKVPEGEIIQISFVDLQMEDDCSKDYVLVRNGRSEDSRTLGKFCGSHKIMPLSSTVNFLTIVFHSDEFGAAKGFKITTANVQQGCGGLIQIKNGNFSSPKYPSRYDNNVECVWTIQQQPMYLIKTEFIGRFDIEQDGSCSKDYIQFEEKGEGNSWRPVQKLCGPVNPGPFISKGNSLRIIFHTNDLFTGDGFMLAFSAVCGGNFTQPSGDIFSPNYPNYYPNYLNCTYTIGKADDYITLTFDNYFSVEVYSNCVFDYVKIYQKNVSESSKQGTYCGNTPPEPMTLLGPVTVRFVTSSTYVAYGFKIHYEISNCGGVLTSPNGTISTSTASRAVTNDMSCTWRIIGQPNKNIQLRFFHFDVKSSSGCWEDYLEVFDGNETGPSLGKFCGEGVENIKSTGNELTLMFRSNNRITSKGFVAFYYNTFGSNHGCGGTINVKSGQYEFLNISSDVFNETKVDCGWMVYAADQDQILKITFNLFNLQMTFNGRCDNDYVEVREYTNNGPVIGRYCGNALPKPIMTNANQVFVHFHADDNARFRFKITFKLILSPCGPSTLISSTEVQTLKTPNYPNAYPLNLRCKWTIKTNDSDQWHSSNSIEVMLTDIGIPCGGDYLEIEKEKGDIYRRPRTGLLKFCGNNSTQLEYYRAAVSVTFNSDAIDNGGHGFSLTYKNADCNRTYTADCGTISSTTIFEQVQTYSRCLMHVTAATGRTIALHFNDFNFPSSPNCSQTYMKIYDGNSNRSSLLAHYCGFTSMRPNSIFSTSNELTIEVNKLQGVSAVYHISYLTTDKGRGCGGSITASEGTVSSPFYPQSYNQIGECLWYIAVPGYQNVLLIFVDIALTATPDCNTNYLEIYKGKVTNAANRVVRYCGQDAPSQFQLLQSNEAVIKLVTDTTNHRSGFFIHFSATGHVPEISSTNFAQRFDNE